MEYPVGTVLHGTETPYGYWCDFYQVIAHTKGGTPRLVQLPTTKQVVCNCPSCHDEITTPVIPPDNELHQSDEMYLPRRNKHNQWQLKRDYNTYLLELYNPEQQYHNQSYY